MCTHGHREWSNRHLKFQKVRRRMKDEKLPDEYNVHYSGNGYTKSRL